MWKTAKLSVNSINEWTTVPNCYFFGCFQPIMNRLDFGKNMGLKKSWLLFPENQVIVALYMTYTWSTIIICSFHNLGGVTSRLEWTSSHQCTSWGWGCSSCFRDESKTHPPLPKVFGRFSLFSAPKFFPPTSLPPTYLPPTYLPLLTYLTSFCAHSIVKTQESLKWGGLN